MPENQTLKINSFPDSFEYTLTDKSLEIYHWNFFQGSRKRKVYLDEIGHRYEIQRSALMRTNFLGLIFLVTILSLLSLSTVFMVMNIFVVFIFTVAFVIFLFFTKSRVILLSAKPEVLIFPCKKSNEVQRESFVKVIIHKSKNYLLWKYGQADEDLPFEKQIQNYKWLRDIEVIDDEEYLELKQNLKTIFDKKKPEA